jgi:hypothetical protein
LRAAFALADVLGMTIEELFGPAGSGGSGRGQAGRAAG